MLAVLYYVAIAVHIRACSQPRVITNIEMHEGNTKNLQIDDPWCGCEAYSKWGKVT